MFIELTEYSSRYGGRSYAKGVTINSNSILRIDKVKKEKKLSLLWKMNMNFFKKLLDKMKKF